MAFIQTAPQLGNQYTADRALRALLAQLLPREVMRDIEATLVAMGELAGGKLYRMQLADRKNEPTLTQWDAWGNRVDIIEVSPLWRAAEKIATQFGLVALAHERAYSEYSRVHQLALVYIFSPSTDFYSCPLAMTDGAACALQVSGNEKLIERALPHLLSRDPQEFWTSGQWMTESTGGSDVGISETIARRDGDDWRLTGRKWFTSAIASQMALTLARPEGNPPGGKGLALFYVETRDAQGRPNGILVNRLKDKLGTRKVPTAELDLVGMPAQLVMGEADGIRNIAPLLNITRTWNSVSAVSLMARGLALARSYAKQRRAFGAVLLHKPLHVDTLAGLQAEFLGALHLTFFIAGLLGRAEAGHAGEAQSALLRLMTPIVKLTTAKQAVAVLSEVIEAFGGAGYVEDTGLPLLLRDAQVLPIWEGTTNVLALDMMRALQVVGGIEVLQREVRLVLQGVQEKTLLRISAIVERTLESASAWLAQAQQAGNEEMEAGARRLALTLGRAFELALLAKHAQWALDNGLGDYALAGARRLCAVPINLLTTVDAADARILASD